MLKLIATANEWYIFPEWFIPLSNTPNAIKTKKEINKAQYNFFLFYF